MNEIKIRMCREYWQDMHKENATARLLIAAVEIAERLIIENNRLKMECLQLRLDAQQERGGGMRESVGVMIEIENADRINDSIECLMSIIDGKPMTMHDYVVLIDVKNILEGIAKQIGKESPTQ